MLDLLSHFKNNEPSESYLVKLYENISTGQIGSFPAIKQEEELGCC